MRSGQITREKQAKTARNVQQDKVLIFWRMERQAIADRNPIIGPILILSMHGITRDI